MSDDDERDLVRGLRRADPGAFHRLVDQYANRLYGLAYSLLHNSEDAEDVVQETLGGAFRGIGAFEQRASLWTWLTRICVRQAARVWRSSPIRLTSLDGLQDHDLDEPAASASKAPPATTVDARVDVAAALEKLAIEHRQIIVLRELQQMSYNEISQSLGIPMGTVESRLYRARAELRQLLQDWK